MRIDIGVPGSEIVVNRDHTEDVYSVLRDAFNAAQRQLEDSAHKPHGDIRTHAQRRRIDRNLGGNIVIIDDR